MVWQDYRSGSDYDIYGARVTPEGAVLDPAGIVISQAAGDQEYPALGFDGANFLVVWEDYRSGDDSRHLRCAGDAARHGARPRGHRHLAGRGRPEYPALAFDGTNFLVVWQDYRSGSD